MSNSPFFSSLHVLNSHVPQHQRKGELIAHCAVAYPIIEAIMEAVDVDMRSDVEQPMRHHLSMNADCPTACGTMKPDAALFAEGYHYLSVEVKADIASMGKAIGESVVAGMLLTPQTSYSTIVVSVAWTQVVMGLLSVLRTTDDDYDAQANFTARRGLAPLPRDIDTELRDAGVHIVDFEPPEVDGAHRGTSILNYAVTFDASKVTSAFSLAFQKYLKFLTVPIRYGMSQKVKLQYVPSAVRDRYHIIECTKIPEGLQLWDEGDSCVCRIYSTDAYKQAQLLYERLEVGCVPPLVFISMSTEKMESAKCGDGGEGRTIMTCIRSHVPGVVLNAAPGVIVAAKILATIAVLHDVHYVAHCNICRQNVIVSERVVQLVGCECGTDLMTNVVIPPPSEASAVAFEKLLMREDLSDKRDMLSNNANLRLRVMDILSFFLLVWLGNKKNGSAAWITRVATVLNQLDIKPTTQTQTILCALLRTDENTEELATILGIIDENKLFELSLHDVAFKNLLSDNDFTKGAKAKDPQQYRLKMPPYVPNDFFSRQRTLWKYIHPDLQTGEIIAQCVVAHPIIEAVMHAVDKGLGAGNGLRCSLSMDAACPTAVGTMKPDTMAYKGGYHFLSVEVKGHNSAIDEALDEAIAAAMLLTAKTCFSVVIVAVAGTTVIMGLLTVLKMADETHTTFTTARRGLPPLSADLKDRLHKVGVDLLPTKSTEENVNEENANEENDSEENDSEENANEENANEENENEENENEENANEENDSEENANEEKVNKENEDESDSESEENGGQYDLTLTGQFVLRNAVIFDASGVGAEFGGVISEYLELLVKPICFGMLQPVKLRQVSDTASGRCRAVECTGIPDELKLWEGGSSSCVCSVVYTNNYKEMEDVHLKIGRPLYGFLPFLPAHTQKKTMFTEPGYRVLASFISAHIPGTKLTGRPGPLSAVNLLNSIAVMHDLYGVVHGRIHRGNVLVTRYSAELIGYERGALNKCKPTRKPLPRKVLPIYEPSAIAFSNLQENLSDNCNRILSGDPKLRLRIMDILSFFLFVWLDDNEEAERNTKSGEYEQPFDAIISVLNTHMDAATPTQDILMLILAQVDPAILELYKQMFITQKAT